MAQVAVGNKPLLTRTIRLGDLPTIPAAGGRTTYEIDSSKNIHAVHMIWTIAGVPATEVEMKAQIADIRVRVGGKVIFDLTATEILDLYHYFNDGLAAAPFVFAGQLPLIFTPMMLPLSHETQEFAIGMLSDNNPSKRNTFVIEINMGAGITVDACELQLEYDDMPSDVIGYHIRWTKYGTTWPTASRQTLDKISHESNALAVLGYHVHHAAGTLTRFDLKMNDSEVISDMPVELNDLRLHRAGRSPVATYESIDFSVANHPKAFLDISRMTNEYLGLVWGVLPGGYDVLIQQLCKNLS